jgi:hypothetical protein
MTFLKLRSIGIAIAKWQFFRKVFQLSGRVYYDRLVFGSQRDQVSSFGKSFLCPRWPPKAAWSDSNQPRKDFRIQIFQGTNDAFVFYILPVTYLSFVCNLGKYYTIKLYLSSRYKRNLLLKISLLIMKYIWNFFNPNTCL